MRMSVGEPNGKIQLFNDPQVNPIVIPIYKNGGKEFLNLVTVLTLHIDPQNLKIPIMGPKKKVVVEPIYGCQNLSGEKYKCNGKKISSIRHTSEKKNAKNHPKIPLS